MKKLVTLVTIAFSISACDKSVTGEDAEAGAARTHDQLSTCIADQYQDKSKTGNQDEIPNLVISSCAGPMAANVEYEYILATSNPNENILRESHEDFSERVTAEKVDDARELIKAWMSTSKQ
ncbi:hypothetical protein ACF8Q9_22110 [Pseudomonas sp. TYF_15]|uniref:hypothetical protein n=1 Tax=Pseudomonas sp. TYF_15 TaxID=3367194 RepID=UPI00370A9889